MNIPLFVTGLVLVVGFDIFVWVIAYKARRYDEFMFLLVVIFHALLAFIVGLSLMSSALL